MSANGPLGFLDTKNQIHLPEGGDFAPSGFVGKTFAMHAFSFMSQTDSTTVEGTPKYASRRQQGDWFVYYYKTVADAKVAMDVLQVEGYQGKDPNATEVWSIMVDRDTVMNFPDQEKLAKWSNPIVGDVRITTLNSKKYRHELHMLALPLAVQAMAKALGYEYEPFSVNDLLRKPEEMAYTDDFFAKMFGNPDATKDDADYYTHSFMWKQRAALWHSLGEEDAVRYQPIGGGKFATESEKLSNCLQILTSPWTASMWARVVNIPDPRVDATYESKTSGETKRNLIPALYELFPSEAAAKAAAREELDRRAAANATSATNGHTLDVPAPKKWIENGVADMWPEKAGELKAAYPTKPSTPVLQKIARENDATAAELAPIWG